MVISAFMCHKFISAGVGGNGCVVLGMNATHVFPCFLASKYNNNVIF